MATGELKSGITRLSGAPEAEMELRSPPDRAGGGAGRGQGESKRPPSLGVQREHTQGALCAKCRMACINNDHNNDKIDIQTKT